MNQVCVICLARTKAVCASQRRHVEHLGMCWFKLSGVAKLKQEGGWAILVIFVRTGLMSVRSDVASGGDGK